MQIRCRAADSVQHSLHLTVEILDRGGDFVLLLLSLRKHRFLIDGNRNVHVQHHGAVQGREHLREMTWFPAVSANSESGELAQDKIVTTDIPARLQSDFVVDKADHAHALHILVIKTAIEQAPPVRSLSRLEAWNIAADHTCELGFFGHMLVESFKNRR